MSLWIFLFKTDGCCGSRGLGPSAAVQPNIGCVLSCCWQSWCRRNSPRGQCQRWRKLQRTLSCCTGANSMHCEMSSASKKHGCRRKSKVYVSFCCFLLVFVVFCCFLLYFVVVCCFLLLFFCFLLFLVGFCCSLLFFVVVLLFLLFFVGFCWFFVVCCCFLLVYMYNYVWVKICVG